MKVPQFQGVLQLNVTPGFYVYVNPEIEEFAITATEFVTRNEANPVHKIWGSVCMSSSCINAVGNFNQLEKHSYLVIIAGGRT